MFYNKKMESNFVCGRVRFTVLGVGLVFAILLFANGQEDTAASG